MNGAKRHYSAFDGWRGIAILWIALGHIVNSYSWNLAGIKVFLFTLSTNFVFPLDVFFILSGFFITGSLLNTAGGLDVMGFLKKRALRILPLYYLLLIAIIIIGNVVPPFRVEKTTTINIHVQWTVAGVEIPGKDYLLENGNGEKAILEINGGSRYAFFYYGDRYSHKVGGPLGDFGIKDPLLTKGGRITLTKTMDLQASFLDKNPGESLLPYFTLMANVVPWEKQLRMYSHAWFVSVIVQFYLFYALLFFVLRTFAPDEKKRKMVLAAVLALLVALIAVTQDEPGPLRFSILLGCLLKILEPYYVAPKKPFWNLIIPAILTVAGGAAVFLIISAQSTSIFLPGLAAAALLMGTSRLAAVSSAVLENSAIRWIGMYSYGIYLFHLAFILFFVKFKEYSHFGNLISIPIYLLLSVFIGAALEKLTNKAVSGLSALPKPGSIPA